MLVLTRTIGKSIIISYNNRNKIEKITVTVLATTTTKTKIGVEAPRRIPTYRQEIYTKIRPQKIVTKNY